MPGRHPVREAGAAGAEAGDAFRSPWRPIRGRLRLTMPMPSTRDRMDKIAWRVIHAQPKSSKPPYGLAACGRPCNYRELYDLMEQRDDHFEFAWSEFRHEFYRHKSASFFEVPPPEEFAQPYRALLAGAAEFWCREFDLPVPAWTEEPQYFLDEWWTPGVSSCRRSRSASRNVRQRQTRHSCGERSSSRRGPDCPLMRPDFQGLDEVHHGQAVERLSRCSTLGQQAAATIHS